MSFHHHQRIGSYRILRQLGEGGMGSVFEAEHISLARRVAIKILHPSYASDPEALARFFNEAKAVNLIDHPGLVQILDYGNQEDCCAYLVMELLRGTTLRSRLQPKSGGMRVPEVLHIGRQLAAALSAAHGCGIVHRDLKPENVMIVPDPEAADGERVKLLDFGIAKLAHGTDAAGVRTQTIAVIGTPAYMSPEQCRGASLVDDRADVYSLGVVLYELLVGHRPFLGTSPGELMGKHLFLDPPCVGESVNGVPAALVSLVATMLRKDREQRPRMTQVLSQIEKIGDPYGLSGRRSGLLKPVSAQVGVTSESKADQEVLSLSSSDLLCSLDSSKAPSGRLERTKSDSIAMRPRVRAAFAAIGTFGLLAISLYSYGRQRGRLEAPPHAMKRPIPPTGSMPNVESATWMVPPTPAPPIVVVDGRQSTISQQTVSMSSKAHPSAQQESSVRLHRAIRTQQYKVQSKVKVPIHEVLED